MLGVGSLGLFWATIAAPQARIRSVDLAIPVGEPHPQDWPGAWHGQCEQDCIVHALLGEKEGGYFIDLAANDAIVLSNTRALERDHGWNGLCIEPNPAYHAGLLEYRNCTVVGMAVSDAIAEAWFDFTFDAKLGKAAYTGAVFGSVVTSKNSSKRPETTRQVWLMPIGPILAAHAAPATIDFMSLDVEGSEFNVMSAFPFERHNITLLLIEKSKSRPHKLIDLLQDHGYNLLCTTILDDLYVHSPSSDKLASWARGPQAHSSCASLVNPHAPSCRRASQLHGETHYFRSGIQKKHATSTM